MLGLLSGTFPSHDCSLAKFILSGALPSQSSTPINPDIAYHTIHNPRMLNEMNSLLLSVQNNVMINNQRSSLNFTKFYINYLQQ